MRVTGVALCGFLAIGVVLPVLPRYVQGPVGGGDVAVGVVFGIFAVAALVSRPIAGRLADRHGGHWVLVVGLATAAVAGALLFVPFGVPSLIVARLVIGVAEGFMAIGGTMLAIELAPRGCARPCDRRLRLVVLDRPVGRRDRRRDGLSARRATTRCGRARPCCR